MVHLNVPLTDGAALAWLYAHGTVLTRDDDDSEAHLDVRLSEAELGRFHSRRISH
jgi:GTP-binding protein HflX